jgi:hypothetical protein
MKLRFHENTLRLRLSQPDVARLAESGRVEEAVTFAPGKTLTYAIEAAGETTGATLEGSSIVVWVPVAEIAAWAGSTQVGLEASSGPLNILIEKDFQCLHPDAGDADAFPNPMADTF